MEPYYVGLISHKKELTREVLKFASSNYRGSSITF